MQADKGQRSEESKLFFAQLPAFPLDWSLKMLMLNDISLIKHALQFTADLKKVQKF